MTKIEITEEEYRYDFYKWGYRLFCLAFYTLLGWLVSDIVLSTWELAT